MKILIASDSYKHCLTSKEVGDSLKAGILRTFPDAEVKVIPVADGGEGTVDALVDRSGGVYHEVQVHGPLKDITTARFGILRDGEIAVMEMSSASGIELLEKDDLDPLKATTFGTGELILKALEMGCKSIIIGLGGSATNDGGSGMLKALGVRLINDRGGEIPDGGGSLAELADIDLSGLDKRIARTDIILASDVQNPLMGEHGATRVYGPQKGAGEKEVEILERNLEHFAKLAKKVTGEDFSEHPGSGAAGGLGFGFLAFTGATLRNGFQLISEMNCLEDEMRGCDIVITGEGRIDQQTKFGKTPYGVATLARKYNKPVIGLAGTLGKGYGALLDEGFDALFSITDRPMSLDESISSASALLTNTGMNLAGILKMIKS
jgi:glycerate kinase